MNFENQIVHGDCLEIIKAIPDQSVDKDSMIQIIEKPCRNCKVSMIPAFNSQIYCDLCATRVCSYCKKEFRLNGISPDKKYCSSKCYRKQEMKLKGLCTLCKVSETGDEVCKFCKEEGIKKPLYVGSQAWEKVCLRRGICWKCRGENASRKATCAKCRNDISIRATGRRNRRVPIYDKMYLMDSIPSDFGYWFSGLIDGEGCFCARKSKGSYVLPSFMLKMRADEKLTFRLIMENMKIGRMFDEKREYGNDMMSWVLQTKAECVALIRFLDKFPLRSKKKRDYRIWRELIGFWVKVKKGPREVNIIIKNEMDKLKEALSKVKKFQDEMAR